MQKLDRYVPFFIFLANLYFLPVSISILMHDGGPHKVSYYILPFSLIINLFILPAFIVMFSKNNSQKKYVQMNRAGFWTIIILVSLGVISVYI
ncbi:hypothetical protein [Flavobacterium hungaricum]|uniref:Uncharacterized protein n=1 Tax=Flavobacterium hungaricum TaxID=2082725 RepID=A0ABR9TG52_9FLAO|nr:hypothetical protein [Flavobacterium hungaricum]MBE8724348.1 hypothetical protein [Flavobacterium hungaricum]